MFKFFRVIGFFIFCVCATEILLRLFFLWPAVWTYVDSHQDLVANSNRLRRIFWIYRSQNVENLGYRIDDYDARRGWKLKAGLQGVECCGTQALHSNSRGIRGTKEYSFARVKGKPRILIFGDSFTFGEQVEDAETYAARLAKLWPGAEVLNFGVHGYGFDQMLLYLRDEGVKYRPDFVVLGYVPDDEHRGMYSFRDYAKPWFEWRGDGVVPELRGVPVPTANEVRADFFWRSRVVDLIAGVIESRGRETSEYWRRVADMSDLLLGEFAGAASAAGAIPVFMYMPTAEGILDPLGPVNRGREDRFAGFCSKLEVSCLNLQPRFSREIATGHSGFAPPTRHWGPVEHRVAAEELFKFLKERLKLRAHEI